jgi:hypothetical protein
VQWHFGDVGRDLIFVSDAPNNGHANEAAKPTLTTHLRLRSSHVRPDRLRKAGPINAMLVVH